MQTYDSSLFSALDTCLVRDFLRYSVYSLIFMNIIAWICMTLDGASFNTDNGDTFRHIVLSSIATGIHDITRVDAIIIGSMKGQLFCHDFRIVYCPSSNSLAIKRSAKNKCSISASCMIVLANKITIIIFHCYK